MEVDMKKSFILIGIVIFLSACNPFKVTDPSDPRFDPTRFNFNDYRSNNELLKALKILLPIGTSKKEAETLLVDIAGVKHPNVIPKEKDLTYTLSGYDGIANSEHDSYKKKIQNAHINADQTVMYQKSKNSTWEPATWNIYVFYDSESKIMQVMVGDKLVFYNGEQK